VLKVEDISRAEIRREHNIETTKVERTPARQHDARSVQDLQKEIEDSWMRLLDFVKEKRPVVPVFQGAPKQAFLAQPPTEQNTEAFLSLELRHIEAKKAFLSEEIASEREREFRLSDSRGTEEQKAPARPTRRREAEFSAVQDGNYPRQHMVLSKNLLAKFGLEKTQTFKASSRRWR
jgi:hypothetical protein